MGKKEKILKLAKGFRGRAKNCIRIATPRVEKALQYAFRDRRQKKRDMRSLWITRINAGSRQLGVRLLLAVPQLRPCTRPCPPAGPRCYVHWHPQLRAQVRYGELMHGLREDNIQVNRKVLSQLAMEEPYSFQALVQQVQRMRGPHSGRSTIAAAAGAGRAWRRLALLGLLCSSIALTQSCACTKLGLGLLVSAAHGQMAICCPARGGRGGACP